MANETTAVQRQGGNFLAMIQDPRLKDQIAAALPKHMTAERMIRVALTAWRKTPALQKCDAVSVIAAVVQASQLGLEPDGVLGHAYLVPYGNQCQLIPGYRGLIDLARRSGNVLSIQAHVVRQRDKFEYSYGLEEKLVHVPHMGEDRGPMIAVYAVAKLRDGGYAVEVMSKSDVDAIRKRSKAANNGPWVTDYDEMAKKTAVRRMAKYLPLSVEMQTAVTLDERAEAGLEAEAHEILADYAIDDSQLGTQAAAEAVAEAKIAQMERELSETHSNAVVTYDRDTLPQAPSLRVGTTVLFREGETLKRLRVTQADEGAFPEWETVEVVSAHPKPGAEEPQSAGNGSSKREKPVFGRPK